MNVGISYWGLCCEFAQHKYEPLDTPDGHRYGRPLLVEELTRRGHTVYALQQRRELVPHPALKYAESFPDLDLLFMEHRWPTYKNDPDVARQSELLNYYKDVPTLVWDTDLEVTADFERQYPWAEILDPCYSPVTLTRKRTRLMFWTDWKELLTSKKTVPYGYVGNYYDRPKEFQKYYFSKNFAVMCGKYPAEIVAANPHVMFVPRQNWYDSMHLLSRFQRTTHISRRKYYERGLVTPRYLEALAVGTAAYVPSSMSFDPLGSGDQKAFAKSLNLFDVKDAASLLESLC